MMKVLEIDLHGNHPSDISVTEIVKQAWEMGAGRLVLIYGHGYWRGRSPGFVNTNTGYFGLCVRGALQADEMRQWIKRSTVDRSHMGSTSVKLKPNSNPTRTELDKEAWRS